MKHRINTGGVCVNCGLDVDQKLTTTCFGKPLHKHSIIEISAGRLDYNHGWIDTSHETKSESVLGEVIERLQKLFPDADIEVRKLADEADVTGVHELMDFLYNNGPCTLVQLMELDLEPEQIINLLRLGRKKGLIEASIKDDILVEYALTLEARVFHAAMTEQQEAEEPTPAPSPEPAKEVRLNRAQLRVLTEVVLCPVNAEGCSIVFAEAANTLASLGLVHIDAHGGIRATEAGVAHCNKLIDVPVVL